MVDFAAHNEEVKKIWEEYGAGTNARPPMVLGVNVRFTMLDRSLNETGVNFREYSENPDVMFEEQARFDRFRRMNIVYDAEMGVPENGWQVGVDFQNYYEAAWFGAPVIYPEGNVPFGEPFLTDGNKNMLFWQGIPETMSGLLKKGRDYYEYFQEKARAFEFEGVKVGKVNPSFCGTDGPFTVACNIRGASEFCLDLYEDPGYAHVLLDFITEATIRRIREWRRYLGQPEKTDGFGFADDSILLLSKRDYMEHVLPYHKRLAAELSNGLLTNSIHLCGDATRHFKMLRDQMNVYSFDTGFPVDHRALSQELGSDVAIYGGPHVELLRSGMESQVREEVRRILNAVDGLSKKFVLREGNNLAPCTPLRNIEAMYDECGKFRYST